MSTRPLGTRRTRHRSAYWELWRDGASHEEMGLGKENSTQLVQILLLFISISQSMTNSCSPYASVDNTFLLDSCHSTRTRGPFNRTGLMFGYWCCWPGSFDSQRCLAPALVFCYSHRRTVTTLERKATRLCFGRGESSQRGFWCEASALWIASWDPFSLYNSLLGDSARLSLSLSYYIRLYIYIYSWRLPFNTRTGTHEAWPGCAGVMIWAWKNNGPARELFVSCVILSFFLLPER